MTEETTRGKALPHGTSGLGSVQRLDELKPMETVSVQEEQACCGPPPGPASSVWERPGYRLWPFVQEFAQTPAGPVPRVSTRLDRVDILGTLRARMGDFRNEYRVAPGLYCVGCPGEDSIVLVTANYKLSFDALRKELEGLDAWILVLDTRGINVWCAAGKDLFSTSELVRMIRLSGLERVVRHRRIILPQLSSTGVSAREVRKLCGFEAVWGPIKAGDLKRFLDAGMEAEPSMRRVTFSFMERLVLVPIELFLIRRLALWALAAIFLLSGIGPGVFSPSAAWDRGCWGTLSLVAGTLGGAVLVPLLLPLLPWRAFAAKGAFVGALLASGVIAAAWGKPGLLGALGILLFATAISSYLAVNFTGSTPFTSPSGVEKEMRKAIPLQAAAAVLSLIFWVATPFVG
jgi:hypothetical protein